MTNSSPHKILILRLSSLGDILLTTPVIRALRRKYPDSHIDFCVKTAFLDSLRHNPWIDNIIPYSAEEHASVKSQIRNNRYSVIIDLHNNLRTRRLLSGISGSIIYRFKKPFIKKFLLVKAKINLLKNEPPIPHRYAGCVPGLELDNEGLSLFIPENTIALRNGGKEFIGICPGAKHFTKRWPVGHFISLSNILLENNYTPVLFGGKDDIAICSEIEKKSPGCINLCNDNNLYETAASMKLCKAVVCNDSGLMHTASAMGVPVVAIFGSTVKEFGFAPYNCKSIILENNSLSCRPCTHIGRETCPKGHLRCLNDVHPTAAYSALKTLILD